MASLHECHTSFFWNFSDMLFCDAPFFLTPNIVPQVAVILFVYYKTRYVHTAAEGISPKCYPYVGHLLEFLENFETLPDWILEYAKKNDFKKTWALYGIRLGALGEGLYIACQFHQYRNCMPSNCTVFTNE